VLEQGICDITRNNFKDMTHGTQLAKEKHHHTILTFRPHVTFDNVDVAYRSELTFLDIYIYITENLKWNVQVRSLSPN
jgi:hypothetical protein